MNKKGFLHSILMMACCLIPMLAVFAFLPQIKSTAAGFNWSWLFLLACPLMHIFMMRGMHGGKEESCHGGSKEAKQISEKAKVAGEETR